MAHRLLSVMYWCPQSCSCTWSSCWLREFIHVVVVYANECHCLLVTSNFTSSRPLIFYVFSYTGVYASPFGVRSTVSLSLRLVVPRVLQLLLSLVPTGAIFEISNTRPIFIFIYTSLELGLFVYDLSCFMSWKDTLLIHNYFEYLSIFDLWTQL